MRPQTSLPALLRSDVSEASSMTSAAILSAPRPHRSSVPLKANMHHWGGTREEWRFGRQPTGKLSVQKCSKAGITYFINMCPTSRHGHGHNTRKSTWRCVTRFRPKAVRQLARTGERIPPQLSLSVFKIVKTPRAARVIRVVALERWPFILYRFLFTGATLSSILKKMNQKRCTHIEYAHT